MRNSPSRGRSKTLTQMHGSAASKTLVLGALLAAGGVVLSAHLAVARSTPARDETLKASPDHVQVWFTQSPSLAVSALSIEGPNGSIEVGKVTAGEEQSLTAGVTGTLAPGRYTLNWQTAGNDGHIMKGAIPFSVAAAVR